MKSLTAFSSFFALAEEYALATGFSVGEMKRNEMEKLEINSNHLKENLLQLFFANWNALDSSS